MSVFSPVILILLRIFSRSDAVVEFETVLEERSRDEQDITPEVDRLYLEKKIPSPFTVYFTHLGNKLEDVKKM